MVKLPQRQWINSNRTNGREWSILWKGIPALPNRRHRMDTNINARQALIRKVVDDSAGIRHADLVERSIRVWTDLAEHLTPLIGEAGFCALYGRAARLAASADHWPAAVNGARSVESLLLSIKNNHALIASEHAAAANFALLDSFTKLLAGLIGDGLTTRLLKSAWADRSQGNENER